MPRSKYASLLRAQVRDWKRAAEAEGLLPAGRGLLTGYTAEECKSQRRYEVALRNAMQRTATARDTHERHAWSNVRDGEAVRTSNRVVAVGERLRQEYADACNLQQSLRHARFSELTQEARSGGRPAPSIRWMGASATMARRYDEDDASPKLGSTWWDKDEEVGKVPCETTHTRDTSNTGYDDDDKHIHLPNAGTHRHNHKQHQRKPTTDTHGW